MAIDQKTWQQLLEAIFVMNSAGNHSSFGEAVVVGLSRLIVADVTAFQVLDRTADCPGKSKACDNPAGSGSPSRAH